MTSHVRDTEVVGNDPTEIEADIRRQREELAQTVDALTAKLDVKAHARARVTALREGATTDHGRPRPELVAAAAATVVAVVVAVWWQRRD